MLDTIERCESSTPHAPPPLLATTHTNKRTLVVVLCVVWGVVWVCVLWYGYFVLMWDTKGVRAKNPNPNKLQKIKVITNKLVSRDRCVIYHTPSTSHSHQQHSQQTTRTTNNKARTAKHKHSKNKPNTARTSHKQSKNKPKTPIFMSYILLMLQSKH
jgi:hypothetical protein